MINYKSLETAIRKATATLTNEGPYHSYVAFALYQNPNRPEVNYTASGGILTAAINPILGKRVILSGAVKYAIPTSGNSFRLANTLEDAQNGVAITVADGSGLIKDADITAEDTFAVLESYQVGQGSNSFLNQPPGYTENEKAYANFYPITIVGPIASISHILVRFSDNTVEGWGPNPYPTLVYGLASSSVTAVPSGQSLSITVKPYMRVSNA